MAYPLKREAEAISTGESVPCKVKTTHAVEGDKPLHGIDLDIPPNDAATPESISDELLDSAAFYTKDIDIETYSGIVYLLKAVDCPTDRINIQETQTQYFAFHPIPKDTRELMDEAPWAIGRFARITYFWDEELLILKAMPTVALEHSHRTLGETIQLAARRIGMPTVELWKMGAEAVRGPRSSKTADTAYKPLSTRQNHDDLATLVIEAAYAKNLGQLRNDARWWFRNSKGDVKIVILILVKESSKNLVIEKWRGQPSTFRRSPMQPEISQTITISYKPDTPVGRKSSYNVVGAPLILEFDQVFLRAAVPPEADITLGVSALQDWASRLWREAKRRTNP